MFPFWRAALTVRPCRFVSSSSRLAVPNEKKDLSKTADMTVSEILTTLEKSLGKHALPNEKDSLSLSGALRHLAWKVRPGNSIGAQPKFVRQLTVNSAKAPTAADLCTLHPFKLLLQNLNKQAHNMGVNEITDIVSAAARKDFTVQLRALDTSVGGQQEVPLLRAVLKRALTLIQQLPFRTLLRAMVVLSRGELGFEREVAFEALTKELIERTAEGPLIHVHWTLLARSLQDMSDFFRLQDVTKVKPSILALTRHFRRLLEKDNQAAPANMILTIQALILLEGSAPKEWTKVRKAAVAKAGLASYPNTLMHLASMDRLDLLREDITYPLIHQMLENALASASKWSTAEIAHVLGTLVQLGFRPEKLLEQIAARLVALVHADSVDEPSARLALLTFAKLNYRDEDLCKALSSVFLSKPAKEERVLKVMSSLWALAVLNVYDKEVFEAGWRLCNAEPPIPLTKRLARKLVGFHLTLTKENPTWEFCRALPSCMSAALSRMKWTSFAHSSSRFHLQVQGTVSRLATGAFVRNEKFNEASKRSVDITLFFPDGLRVAIECNGPTHYLRPSGYAAPSLAPWPLPGPEPIVATYVPCGETLFKQRTLEAAGMTVIQIPWWEWYRANKTEKDRRLYMQNKLHALGIPTMTMPLSSTAAIVARFKQREIMLQEKKQFISAIQELHALEGEVAEVAGLLTADNQERPSQAEIDAATSDEDEGPLRCGPIHTSPEIAEQFQAAERDATETVEAILGSQDFGGSLGYMVQFKGTASSDAFWAHEEEVKGLPGFKQALRRFKAGAPVVEETTKKDAVHSFTYRDPVTVMPTTLEDLAAQYFPNQEIPQKLKEKAAKLKRPRKSKVKT